MPITPLDLAPESATQGDTLAWRIRDDVIVPTAGWTVSIRLATTATAVDVPATADGAAWLVVVASEQSRRFAAGPVAWTAVAAHPDGTRRAFARGVILFDALPELGGAFDPGWRRRRIQQLQQQILRLDHLESYGHGDRTAKRLSAATLLAEMREHERALLLEEGRDLGAVQVVFR